MIVTSATAGSTQGTAPVDRRPAPEHRDRKHDREHDRHPRERIHAAPHDRRPRHRLARVFVVDGAPRLVERFVRRLLARHHRSDRELKALRNLRVDRHGRPRVAVHQHLPEAPVPLVLAEDREIAVDAPAHRQVPGRFADACGVRGRFDVADELDRGALPRRVAREDDPDPAAGAGRPRAGVGLGNRRDVPFREVGRREPRLQILQLPVAAEKHGDVAGDGRARQLLIVVVPDHRSRRRAALNRVAQKAEQPEHRAPVRFLAEDRAPVAVDELAALGPEHREVIEHRRLPAAGVVEIARRHAARARRGSPCRGARPRCAAAPARDPCGRRARGSRFRATGRRRGRRGPTASGS